MLILSVAFITVTIVFTQGARQQQNQSPQPSTKPSSGPLAKTLPTTSPSLTPSVSPSTCPSLSPTFKPSLSSNSASFSLKPSSHPSTPPLIKLSGTPSAKPSKRPFIKLSANPSKLPSNNPSRTPTSTPSSSPFITPTISADEITSLPGWTGNLPSRQYSGYLSLPSGSNLHYWMVESENDPVTDPTIFWFNGGPGCSSLDGFMYELGPFIINPNLTLSTRPGRWNQLANMVYIESPVGVGFSYSNSLSYKTDDDRTAQENKQAISLFFTEKFPQLKANKFFIAGESYAGIYVPTLAEAILNGTKDGSFEGPPLDGIAVGNGCVGTELGICGGGYQATYIEWTYLVQTALVPNKLKDEINSICDWNSAKLNLPNALSSACTLLLQDASKIISNVNLYNIYGDCVTGGCASGNIVINPDDASMKQFDYVTSVNNGVGLSWNRIPPRELEVLDGSVLLSRHLQGRVIPRGPVACIDSILASAYLNQPSVMNALHVKPPGICWEVCVTVPEFVYKRTRKNLPRDTYPYLIANMRVLIYNGDWDACVPYTDNELWTTNMNFTESEPWHPWKYTSLDGNSNQIAGYATVYNVSSLGDKGSFTFVTVKGGGHMVPTSASAQALELLRRFINGTGF